MCHQGDEHAGAPVLQRGGPELKSTAWQQDVASGVFKMGCGAPPRVWRLSASGPSARIRLHTPPRWAYQRSGQGTLWAFATEAFVGFLRVGLQAGRPYGPALAAVAVDSVEARLPGLASIPSKSRYSRVVKIIPARP